MADDDFSPAEELARMRAQLDQAAQAAAEIAHLGHAWYDAFIAEGFQPPQALYLTAVELVQNPGKAP